MKRCFQILHVMLKVFVITVVCLLAVGAVAIGREIYSFRGYREAEAVQPVVWKVAERMIELNDRKYLLPASVDEWLAELSVEERLLLRNCQLRLTPDLDPMFAAKVNDRYGFQIDAKGQPAWMAAEKLAPLFSR